MLKPLLPAAALLVLMGCSSHPQESGADNQFFTNTQWQMVNDGAYSDEQPMPDFIIEQDKNNSDKLRIAGSTSCNRFFGEVVIKEDKLISHGPMGMTQMICDEQSNKIEFDFMRALERGLRFENDLFTTSDGTQIQQVAFDAKLNTH